MSLSDYCKNLESKHSIQEILDFLQDGNALHIAGYTEQGEVEDCFETYTIKGKIKMNLEDLKKTKKETKKITTVYIDPELKKFLDDRGFNISKTINQLLTDFTEKVKKDESR